MTTPFATPMVVNAVADLGITPREFEIKDSEIKRRPSILPKFATPSDLKGKSDTKKVVAEVKRAPRSKPYVKKQIVSGHLE